ncbi:cocaine- and amphetamine-regulated transcript 4 [Clinocottus analis]|uniref:cocaine- and amphetamine-regulated transcript 4 n=1 Tax=Clinocottus analis TaxID=304258 RepID=UPI0035BF21FE
MMDGVRVVLLLSVLTALCEGQRSADRPPSAADDPTLGFTSEELAEALQGFLGDSSVGLSVQKKASVIPRCDVGERCAMKHGPRIGRLCDCLRGTACNSFFLRCY